jgi:hypothetical protein
LFFKVFNEVNEQYNHGDVKDELHGHKAHKYHQYVVRNVKLFYVDVLPHKEQHAQNDPDQAERSRVGPVDKLVYFALTFC